MMPPAEQAVHVQETRVEQEANPPAAGTAAYNAVQPRGRSTVSYAPLRNWISIGPLRYLRNVGTKSPRPNESEPTIGQVLQVEANRISGLGDVESGRDPNAKGNDLGRIQALLALLWMLLAFCGFILFICGLSAFQHYIKDSRNTSRWSIPSNFPYLTPARVLRWDWWVLFGHFFVWLYAGILMTFSYLVYFRTGVVALFAAFGVLMSIEADRFYNARSFVSDSSAQWKSTSVVFAGAIVCALSDFMLAMILGASQLPHHA